TVNYLYGLADWSVSIAAEVAGTVVAGVVAVPLHGETYLAALGHGATVRTSSGQTTVAGRADRAALRPGLGPTRGGGSAAVDLCSVPAGRLDAFYERGLNPWDYSAGGLIAAE